MAQVEFRDGYREVPDHLASMMAVFETYKITYDEAIKKANDQLTRDFLNKSQQSVLNEHFKRPF